MRMAIDQLIQRIEEKQNPTALGLDTRLEYLPSALRAQVHTWEDAAEAIYAYNTGMLEALASVVPCVKIQAAYYEMYGPMGVTVMHRTIEAARKKDLTVIVDGKRNDIGATASAYSAAYLGRTNLNDEACSAFPADFLTVNPYLGSDGIQPFVTDAKTYGTGIFVLVKTSNPSSGELQDLQVDGQALYTRVGQLVSQWGEAVIGEEGYSAVGAVVGATYPKQAQALRAQMPHIFFLVPGYGAQGGTARDLSVCFDAKGRGAVVNASRSLLCAWKKADTEDYAQAAYEEALRMKADIREALEGVR